MTVYCVEANLKLRRHRLRNQVPTADRVDFQVDKYRCSTRFSSSYISLSLSYNQLAQTLLFALIMPGKFDPNNAQNLMEVLLDFHGLTMQCTPLDL